MERHSRARTNDQRTTPISLGTAGRRIMRHRSVVLFCLIICGALGAVLGIVLPNSYEAKAVINVTQPSSGGSGIRASINAIDMDTEEAIAGSRIVLQAASEELGMEISDLKDMVNTAGHSNSTVLDVIVNSDSPEKSAEVANAVAQAYLQHRSDTIRANREETRKNIDDASKGMDKLIVDQAILGLEATSTNSGTIISMAQAPNDPSNFTIGQTIFIGAGMGLLIGIFAAYVVDRTSRSLGYPERLSEIAHAPISIIKNGSEEESISQLLRRIGVADGQLRNAEIDGLMVFSPTPQQASALTSLIGRNLSEASYSLLDAPAFNALSMEKMKTYIKENKPVLVEAPASASLAKVLLASDQCGVLILPFTPKSTVKSARRLFDEITPASSTQVIPVFFDIHSKEK